MPIHMKHGKSTCEIKVQDEKFNRCMNAAMVSNGPLMARLMWKSVESGCLRAEDGSRHWGRDRRAGEGAGGGVPGDGVDDTRSATRGG
ncbi:hypothetical protein NL676_017420 [Syzygium grande]|nr:hypothetical protein NL676_017420 [Syzygium grande]